MRLAGVDLSSSASAPQAVSSNVAVTPADQTIKTEQNGDGYSPGEAVIYAGRPTHWVLTSTAPFSCAASLGSQDLGCQQVLNAGRNVVELPKLAVGTYNFSCAMGM